MRSIAFLLGVWLPLFFAARATATAHNMAATPVPAPLSKQAVLQLDDLECQLQAEQQNIVGRNQARFVRHCMAERQRARKATAPKQ